MCYSESSELPSDGAKKIPVIVMSSVSTDGGVSFTFTL
jgi:hypothetical protein